MTGPDGPEVVGQDGVGVPDALQRLWTPHRLSYVQGTGKAEGDEPAGCPFCRVVTLSDEDGLIVARGAEVFAVLNLYPYNPGHLMVLPYRHVPDYTDLTPSETAEFAAFTQKAMRVVRHVAVPHGDHVDYVHDGHRHGGHDGHWDDH